jgi:hypothetical protein
MSSPSESGDSRVPETWSHWLGRHGFQALFGLEDGKPHLFDQLEWAPADEDRQAAWKVYTELRTRISTQPLAYRAGDEATALDSVYRLFELSRSSIKDHEGCTHFATLTVRILNDRVRPFTAKWHRMKIEGHLASADFRFQFRRELAVLQPTLRQLTHLLGLLSGELDKVAAAEAELPMHAPSSVPNLWAEVEFGIGEGTRGLEGIRTQINDKESEEVRARRSFYSLGNAGTRTDAVGLSLSGGGIRSATFALGVVQQLARKGILRQVDYLSTVSGGGYLGSFISSFLADNDERINLSSRPRSLPFGGDGDGESQGVRQLRNHSKYLTEGGARTLATMISLVGYGVLTSILLIAPFLLVATLIARIAFEDSFKNLSSTSHPSTPTTIALGLLAGMVLILPVIQNFARGRKIQLFWKSGSVGLAALSAVFLACEFLPGLLEKTSYLGGPGMLFFCAAILPFVLGVLGVALGVKRRLGRLSLDLLSVTGPLLIAAAFLWLSQYAIIDDARPSLTVLAVITAAALFYSTFILNINFASPHAFYRDRLTRTYLTRAVNGDEAVQRCDPQPLSGLNPYGRAPYHLINCAVNIPGCKDPNLRGRNTDFFLFSKHFCGGPITGVKPTPKWEKMDSHLDLGTAMAISGAAAAPNMGTLTSPRYRFWLALLNLRLGYWLRRPAEHTSVWDRFRPPTGWYYFFLEVTGLMSDKTRYLNLSDGGHIENLGIYELLRRRCKFVIAVDGEADPQRSFGGLLTLTQLAKIDLGVTIEPDLADLRAEKDGLGRAHFGLSRIDYPDGSHGVLLYVKSSLTGNESEFLRKYRAENPDFPHQSTAQQLFSETQFEAYRALGEHIARDLFRPDLVGAWDSSVSVHEWFKQLAFHLLD